jgi:hypothetical protein
MNTNHMNALRAFERAVNNASYIAETAAEINVGFTHPRLRRGRPLPTHYTFHLRVLPTMGGMRRSGDMKWSVSSGDHYGNGNARKSAVKDPVRYLALFLKNNPGSDVMYISAEHDDDIGEDIIPVYNNSRSHSSINYNRRQRPAYARKVAESLRWPLKSWAARAIGNPQGRVMQRMIRQWANNNGR